MNSWFSEMLVLSLGWTLVHFLWQGVVLAVLLSGALRLMRRASSQARYVTCCAAMTLMFIAPVVTFCRFAAQIQAPPVAINETIVAPLQPDAAPANVLAKSSPAKISKIPLTAQSWADRLETAFPWLVFAWLVGVFALSCRLLGGWLQIKRLKSSTTSAAGELWRANVAKLSQRLGIKRSVRLVQSALVEVPTVVGWLRPVILLPASCLTGLTPAQLESVLAHELAHIRRHDYLVNLLQSVVETLLFYHPAVWWISRRIREERENCCDDLAVEVCGDRLAYARALATLEELRLAPAPLALAASGSPLLPRIRQLAGHSNLARPVWPLAGLAVLILVASLAIGLRGNRALAAENANSQKMDSATGLPSPKTFLAQTNKIITGKGRKLILSKLKSIEVDSMQFEKMPLTEVIGWLARFTQSHDPSGVGINFFVDRESSHKVGSSHIDPATGLPVKPADIGEVTVTINPQLKHVTLADALDAITKTADQPIEYSVLDYGVVFSSKDVSGPQLDIRAFHVDTNAFEQALEKIPLAPAVDAAEGGIYKVTYTGNESKTSGAHMSPLAARLRQFLSTAGLDLDTNNPANVGKAFAYTDRKGMLLVRATTGEIEKIEAAIQKLLFVPSPSNKTNQSPGLSAKADAPKTNAIPEVNLKVKFVEMDASLLGDAGIQMALPTLAQLKSANVKAQVKNIKDSSWPQTFAVSTNALPLPHSLRTVSSNGGATTNSFWLTDAIVSQVNGVLSYEQFTNAIEKLEMHDGVDELTAPEVTTLSERQAQVQAVTIQDIALGMIESRDKQGRKEFDYHTQKLPFGPVVDLIPRVSADGDTIHLKVIATVTEFLGYGDPSHALNTSPPSRPDVQPQPNFRLRQMKAEAVVHDLQTIMLAGMESERVLVQKEQAGVLAKIPLIGSLFTTTSTAKSRKCLLVFITPTLINANGTRFHPDDAVPSKQASLK